MEQLPVQNNSFSNLSPKVNKRAKINKWSLIKSFCIAKKIIDKDNVLSGRKILPNVMTDKGLIFKVHKQHI